VTIATNKRLLISESRDDSNRCTPCRGKPNQHDTYASCGQSSYMANFHETLIDLDRSHCSWEKGLPTQFTTHRLTDPWVHTYLLSRASQWSRGVSQAPIGNQLLGLPGPYHWHAIGTFNTCSQGPTHRSLTDTGGGYNLRGADLPHTHSPIFPTICLPFPPKGWCLR
jgi:hypothetical protein